MKQFIILITAIALAVASCTPKVNPEQEQEQNPGENGTPNPDDGGESTLNLTLSADKMVFSSYGGIQTFSVTTNSETFSAAAS